MIEQNNETVIWLFDIGGSTEIDLSVIENNSQLQPDVTSKNNILKLSQNTVSELNNLADEFNGEIEKEIKRVLKGNLTVQSEILFQTGSIILSGTVALISWGGGAVLNALQKEVESQISTLVKMSVQRAVNKIIRQSGFFNLKPIEVETSAHKSNTKIIKRNAILDSNDEFGDLARKYNHEIIFLKVSQKSLILILLFIITMIQFVLLFNKYFTIALK